MLLPQLDFAQLIRDYNRNYRKAISETEEFSCPYFKSTLLDLSQELIAGINDSANTFIFSEEENQYLVQRRSELMLWQVSARTSGEPLGQLYQRFKEAYVLPTVIAEKDKLNRWKKDHYEVFQNSDEIKAGLQSPALFAHSHQAICEIALNLLPQLIQHYQQAQKDIKWYYFFIPTPIYTAYKNYVEGFLTQAEALKQALTVSMFERLKIWDESGWKHADIMVHLADQLGITHPPARKLTATQFSLFHHYIQQHGSERLKERLREFSWFQSPVLPLKIVKCEQATLCVPPIVEKDCPSRIRKPNWFFKGANLRYLLCEQHSMALVQLQQLPEIEKLAIDVSKPDELRYFEQLLDEKQQLATKLHAETQTSPYTDTSLGFGQWSTRRFLNNYRATLQDYTRKTLEKQLQLAEGMIQQLTDKLNPLTKASITPCLTYDVLIQLLGSLRKQIEAKRENRIFQERFLGLQQRSEKVLTVHKIIRDFHQLANGAPITQSAFANLKHALGSLTPEEKAQLGDSLQSLILKFTHLLHQQLKQNPAELKEEKYIEHAAYIKQLHDILAYMAPAQLNEAFTRRVTRYFLMYLNALVDCGVAKAAFNSKESLFEETFEAVLNYLPCTHAIAIDTQTLAAYVATLSKLRTQNELYELAAEAESLNKLLGERYLIQRTDKDCQRLDQQITAWLQGSPLHCCKEAIQLAFKLRDVAVEYPELGMREVAKKLNFTTTQEVLIGLKPAEDSKAYTVIPHVMALSSRARYLQKLISEDQTSYEQKVDQLHDFQNYLKQTLANLRKPLGLPLPPSHLGQTKHASFLFFKEYIPGPDNLSEDLVSPRASRQF